MKRCPKCNRAESDDSLAFCRADGTRLLSDSSFVSEGAGTLRFDSAHVTGETETRTLQTGDTLSRPTAPTTMLDGRRVSVGTQELSKPKSRRGVVLVVAALAVAALAAAAFYSSRKEATSIESIAVMPFVNESGNADNEYLSDGMSETLINSLSQLPNLNVKARSSVFRYKGKEFDPKKIASELNVQAVLNGRVVQRGEQLILNLELINAQTENVIWSESYTRKQADLVSLQSEVARDVSGKIRTRLSGEDIAKVTKTYTTNPEAYQLYLKGRYHSTKYTEEGFNKGIEYFNQAIALDPNYALAYDGLAYCYYAT